MQLRRTIGGRVRELAQIVKEIRFMPLEWSSSELTQVRLFVSPVASGEMTAKVALERLAGRLKEKSAHSIKKMLNKLVQEELEKILKEE